MMRVKNISLVLVLSLVVLTITSSYTVEAQGLVEYGPAFMLAAVAPNQIGQVIVVAPSRSPSQPPPLVMCFLLLNATDGYVISTDKGNCIPGAHGGPTGIIIGFNVAETAIGATGFVRALTPSMGNLYEIGHMDLVTPSMGPGSPMK